MEMAEVKLDIEILRVKVDQYHESLIKSESSLKKLAEERREIGTQTDQHLEPIFPTCPNIMPSVLVISIQETNVNNSKPFAECIQDERKKQSEIIYSTINPTP